MYGKLKADVRDIISTLCRYKDVEIIDPESVRGSKAMQALYDNVGGDEVLAVKIHKAVMNSKMSGFRGDSIKENRIKRALFAILNDDAEVERLFKIIEKQEEY